MTSFGQYDAEAGAPDGWSLAAAGPSYAEVLAALHADAFAEAWSAASIAGILSQPGVGAFVIGAAGDSVPAGFVIWRRAADEAEILTLAMAPGHRRQGGGRTLMRAVAAAVAKSGGRHLHLEVAADNEAARSLYQGLGFHVVGRRPHYYRRQGGEAPVDAVLYRLDLVKKP